jgi:molybdopterin/thiamine biosynthesis adenylyltransferase
MSVPPDQFARLQGQLNRMELAGKLVVVAGVGAVGSQVAYELANHAVGCLRVIDHGTFKVENRPRHALPIEYIGWNKAEAVTVYLSDQVPGLRAEAIPHEIGDSVSDDQLDLWLRDADLIIAATDEREAQRRIGRRALALDIPALFPGLYEGQGGEVFLQRSARQPCFLCWDGWRPSDQAVRGAAGGNADILEIIALTTQIALGILDPTSNYVRRFLAPDRGARPPQLFVRPRAANNLARRTVRRRPDCESCAVGPARVRMRRSRQSNPPTAQQTPHPEPTSPPSWPRAVLIGLGIVILILILAAIPTLHSPESSQQVPTTGSVATNKRPAVDTPSTTATDSQPPPPKATGKTTSRPGASVATALPITPGVLEAANVGAVAYGNGPCGPEKGQFWKIALHQGQEFTIVWGGPIDAAMGGLDIWPPGITHIHGSDEHRLAHQSREGAEEEELKFMAPTTGEYPIVIDDSCGHPGTIRFTVAIRPG